MAASSQPSPSDSDLVSQGLAPIHRTITGHRDNGEAHFVLRDHGDHHQMRKAEGRGYRFEALETSLYCTFATPVDIKGNVDIEDALHGWQGGHHASNGTRATMLDFNPGGETPMHRGESLDYNVVIEGEFELILDSGEVHRLRRGDVNIQRATAHKWRNVTNGGTGSGRLFSVLVDILPLEIDGQRVRGYSEDTAGPYGVGSSRLDSLD